MIENRWVTSESNFVEMEWWDACVDQTMRPLIGGRSLPVWIGLDASLKRDSTAIVAVTFDRGTSRARLVWHRVFQPSPDDPLNFEATVESTLLELHGRFDVREIRYDPYQLVAVAQRLSARGLRMVEFAQSVPNLTEASSNLYELIKGRNLAIYPDAEMRLAVSRCVALETSRGWRIAKEKVSHKIDVVVALAMAALGAVQGGQRRNGWLDFIRADTARMERETGLSGNGLCANPSCRGPMPADGTVFQSRGLQFCSLQCAW
jgi:phage terminase large subunit-like protein